MQNSEWNKILNHLFIFRNLALNVAVEVGSDSNAKCDFKDSICDQSLRAHVNRLKYFKWSRKSFLIVKKGFTETPVGLSFQ